MGGKKTYLTENSVLALHFCPNNHETCLLSPLEYFWVVFALLMPKATRQVYFYHLKEVGYLS